MDANTIHHGDALTLARGLESQCVNAIISSPPYYGLRDYGTGEWGGGSEDCDHVYDRSLNGISSTLAGGKTSQIKSSVYRDCPKCGATRDDSQIGHEETPEDYVKALVEVFRELRRVLRDEGTLWLVLGHECFREIRGARPHSHNIPPLVKGCDV